MLANEISEFVIDLHWWFKQSAASSEDLEDVQQELGLAQHKFLKHVESRWLSHLPVVVRAFEQFQAPEKYLSARTTKETTLNDKQCKVHSHQKPAHV